MMARNSHNTLRTGFRFLGERHCRPGRSRGVQAAGIFLPQNSTLNIEQTDNTTMHTELVNNPEERAMDLDVEAVEAVEALEQQLDAFIERRAREARDANRVEELWQEPAAAPYSVGGRRKIEGGRGRSY